MKLTEASMCAGTIHSHILNGGNESGAVSAGRGGKQGLRGGMTLVLDHAQFLENKAGNNGGAVNWVCTGEHGHTGDNKDFASRCSARITRSTFMSNTCKKTGGALVLERLAHVVVTETHFKKNRALTQRGGGIAIREIAEFQLLSSILQENMAENGAALLLDFLSGCSGCSVIIEKSVFRRNVASSRGSGAMGGALLAWDHHRSSLAGTTKDSIRILSSTFLNNVANDYIGHDYDIEAGKGGAIYVISHSVLLMISKTVFLGNRAGLGGAINAEGFDFKIEIDSSTMTGNTAGIPDCRQGYCLGKGGAIYLKDFQGNGRGSCALESTVLTENAATHSGGALAVQDKASLRLSSSCLVGNTANSSGGAIWVEGAQNAEQGAQVAVEHTLISVNSEPWIAVHKSALMLSQSNISAEAAHLDHTTCGSAGLPITTESSEVNAYTCIFCTLPSVPLIFMLSRCNRPWPSVAAVLLYI